MATKENSLMVPRKSHQELADDPAILCIEKGPREIKMCIHIKTCAAMFPAALAPVAKRQNNPVSIH